MSSESELEKKRGCKMSNNNYLTTFKIPEKVNVDRAKKLLEIPEDILRDFLWTHDKEADNGKKKVDKDVYIKMLIKYLKQSVRNGGVTHQTYKFSSHMKDNGRVFHSGSFAVQGMQKKLRGYLVGEYYVDYDMKNAHPTILLYVLNKYYEDYDFPKIEKYVKNRSRILEKYELDKTDVLVALNSNKKAKTKCPFFKQLDAEFKLAQNLFFNDPPSDYAKYKKPKEANAKGCFLNAIMCIYENEILAKCLKSIDKSSISALAFDGALLSKDLNSDEILKKFNKITLEYGISWAVKPHSDFIEKNIDDLEYIPVEVKQLFLNINEIAHYMLNEYFEKELFRYGEDDIAVFDRSRNVWIGGEKGVKRYLYSLVESFNFKIESGKDEKDLNSSRRLILDVVGALTDMCHIDNEMMNDILLKFEGKICFKNGYYDFEDGRFKNMNNELKPFVKINRDFDEKSDPDIRKQIFDKILHPIFGVNGDEKRKNLMEYFLHNLSQVMSGNKKRKDWFLIRGLRNSGKGVIDELIMNSFLDYAGVTNSPNFITKDLTSDDASKSLSWLIKFRFKRMMICDEFGFKKNQTLNTTLIKKVRNGGLNIEMRGNYINDLNFKHSCGLMFTANEFPELKDADCMLTCHNIYLTSKFVDKDDVDERGAKYQYYPKDDSIKDFIMRKDVVNEFILILTDFYNRPVILDDIFKNKSDVEEGDIQKIKRLFSFDPKSYVTVKEFNHFLKSCDVSSPKDFKLKIINTFDDIKFNVLKKINGKPTRVVEGLVINEQEEDED